MKRFSISGAAVLVLSFAAALTASAAFGIAAVNGQLTHLGCINEGGTGGCVAAVAMDEPLNVAMSTDESRVLVASHTSDGVAILTRNRSTGLLTQQLGPKGCVTETGTGGSCGDGRAMDGTADVASTGDFIYWAADTSNAVGFARKDAESKNWVQPAAAGGCVSNDGSGSCVDGRGLPGAQAVAISQGGNFVYVGGTNSIAVFSRNAQGFLTQLGGTNGCINDDGSDGCFDGYVPDTVQDLYVTQGGKFIYAAASGGLLSDGAVLIFSRDLGTGALTEVGCVNDGGTNGCVDGVEMKDPTGVMSDKDNGGGLNLYVAAHGSDAVDVFSRDKITGLLTQLGGTSACVSETGSLGACVDGYKLTAPWKVNVYKTNKFVEVTSDDGVSNFARDKHTGVITQLPGMAQCISDDGDAGQCFDGNGLMGAYGIATTGGGKNAYVTGSTSDAVDALKVK